MFWYQFRSLGVGCPRDCSGILAYFILSFKNNNLVYLLTIGEKPYSVYPFGFWRIFSSRRQYHRLVTYLASVTWNLRLFNIWAPHLDIAGSVVNILQYFKLRFSIDAFDIHRLVVNPEALGLPSHEMLQYEMILDSSFFFFLGYRSRSLYSILVTTLWYKELFMAVQMLKPFFFSFSMFLIIYIYIYIPTKPAV